MSEVEGVNKRNNWNQPPSPQMPDNAQPRQVLIVDREGRPLVVKAPRAIGFRKP